MRALCSVRGPLSGEARALGAGARFLSLRLASQCQPLHFVVEAKARVKDLKALASSHAQIQGMTDIELFGLAIMQSGEYMFVDLESKLSKYAPKSWRSSHTHGLDANGKPLLELHFVVQFHVESPLLLHDEIGRNLYFQQLRYNVRTRDALPTELLLLLTGLALQAEYGDIDNYEDRDYFKVDDYASASLTGDWVSAAMRACHREHRGLSKSDAVMRFIREVCLLPDTINSHRYRLKQTKTELEPGTIWLLVTAKGVKILPDNGPVSNFVWSSIGKLSFDRKKFEIRTEEGKITLYSTNDEKCKYLFALCRETHQFSMKIAPKFNEIMLKEEDERKICYGYSKSLNVKYNQNKSEQRISVISTTSSNTTSGIVSDRVQSEDELEIMIDSPPAPSTESLAFAHLLDCSNSYFIRHIPQENPPLSKTSSLQLPKLKERNLKNNDGNDNILNNGISPEIVKNVNEETNSLPDRTAETSSDSPVSAKLKCAGSQCSSSCSTVIMARSGMNTLSRASDASSLELGYSHTAQNSMLSDNSTTGIDLEYSQDTASALYDGLGHPITVAASSETSGVYTMGSSELTARSKMDTLSEDCRTDYGSSHYEHYKPAKVLETENDLADFDSVSSILKSKSERSNNALSTTRLQGTLSGADCIDGNSNFSNIEPNHKENIFRERTNSNVSATSFHGDGSDPTDTKRNILTASELSDLIVGRGVYPKKQSVSDTLDSVSDYVRLPLPFSGDSYLQGHEDTAPSDDNYPNDSFFDRPPTPPTRTDSRKVLNLSLPNILDVDDHIPVHPRFPDKPPPPYEYNHKTLASYTSATSKAPPAYPGTTKTSITTKSLDENEEVAARVVTSKPMITILKAEAGDVSTSSERTFAGPMVLEHRFQKSKRHQASSRRAERSKLAQGINNLSPSREIPPPHGPEANVLVAMMKLPPPPPPRRARLPPPPPIARMPPPPPPHNPMFHQQLYSDVDYVYYPLQDPNISQQNYLDHKLTESRVSNMHKSSLQYRSTPYLSTSMSVSSMYGSIQNLSDSYIQIPGTRASWYSLTSRTLSNHSVNVERPPLPISMNEIPKFTRVKSNDILNMREPPPMRTRRMPPPPPPPYEHKKKLPSHLRDLNTPSNANVNRNLSANKVKDNNNCDLDIKTLREKSKNLDLPLIAALCNDRSLLKQTKAFGALKISKQSSSECESERKSAKYVQNSTDSVDIKSKQETMSTGTQKKVLIRHPTDKLPALPGTEAHTPRALSNTYVMHPSVVKTKRTQPSS